MNKEVYKRIKGAHKAVYDLKGQLIGDMAWLIDNALNRHDSEELSVMFQQPLVIVENVSKAPHAKALGINVVTGIKMVKTQLEKEHTTITSLFLISEESGDKRMVDGLPFSALLDIFNALDEVIQMD